MVWLLTIAPTLLILGIHFGNQRKSEFFVRASNYWILFYVTGYFLPIPLFVAGEDAWTTIWGYSFSNFRESLNYAVLIATTGGLVLSIAAAPRRKRILRTPLSADQLFRYRQSYKLNPPRIFLVAAVVIVTLTVGIELVGGLWYLLSNLGDRIILFAGLNGFFLPLYLLIGVCFAISASRAVADDFATWLEWAAIAVTLPSLLLLGSKANIFILIVGITIIKLISFGGVKLRWALLATFVFTNLLMLYELIFREALIIGLNPERLTLGGWLAYLHLQITGNFMQIQNLTVLVEALPETLPYSMGDTYIAIPSLIIPQSFIDIKPPGSTSVYTSAFWPQVVARESTTMPPGLFGEAYLNFGVSGYLAACLIVGLALRTIDRQIQSAGNMNCMQIVSIAAFGSMALHFIRGELFAPFLILVGIFIGARIAVTARRPRSAGGRCASPTLSNLMISQSVEESSSG